MGLDAVVYRNARSLGYDLTRQNFHIDGTTGEVFPEDDLEGVRHPHSTFQAIHKRLGNIATVAHLRNEVASALGSSTGLLQTRILYNGEHCGDVIGLELLDEISKEVALLTEKNEGLRSPYLTTFLDDVKDLIRTARAENNPIVFT